MGTLPEGYYAEFDSGLLNGWCRLRDKNCWLTFHIWIFIPQSSTDRGREGKRWTDKIKERTSLPSQRCSQWPPAEQTGRWSFSAESSLMSPRRPNQSMDWPDLTTGREWHLPPISTSPRPPRPHTHTHTIIEALEWITPLSILMQNPSGGDITALGVIHSNASKIVGDRGSGVESQKTVLR